jgi:XisI protein
MDTLRDMLLRAMEKYAKPGLNSRSYLTINEVEQVYTFTTISMQQGKRVSFVSLIVRLVDDRIIIEEDRNSKILMATLLQMGVAREQIVLAYAGEPTPLDMLM